MNLERLQWVAKRVQDAGGKASVMEVLAIDGVPDSEIIGLFNQQRASDYKELLVKLMQIRRGSLAEGEVERIKKRLCEVQEIDFFKCSLAEDVAKVLASLQTEERQTNLPRLKIKDYQSRVWLTRPRPEIDRVGSAWLIKRFIDPKASFVFNSSADAIPGAIPFDMSKAELSHYGDDCTFETLLKRFHIQERRLIEIGEMIHDVDLEDEKFGHREGYGLHEVFKGLAAEGLTDAEILEKGFEMFDAIYKLKLRK